jgi:serine/threonine protein kinase
LTNQPIFCADLLVGIDGTIKLSDFGASKQLVDVASCSYGDDRCNTVAGSPYWMAPEVIQGNTNYGRKADIWSVGCVVVEMATGMPPFGDLPPVTALFKIGSEHVVPPIPGSLSEPARDLLSLCFNREPSLRPTARALLAHPFVAHAHVQKFSATSSRQQFIFQRIDQVSQQPPPSLLALPEDQEEGDSTDDEEEEEEEEEDDDDDEEDEESGSESDSSDEQAQDEEGTQLFPDPNSIFNSDIISFLGDLRAK